MALTRKEIDARYRARNKEKIAQRRKANAQYFKDYWARNHDRRLAIQKKYRDRNKSELNRKGKEWYLRAKDTKEYKDKRLKYFQSERGKKTRLKSVTEFARKYPKKRKAIQKVCNLMIRGKMQRPSFCSLCGSSDPKIQNHHISYDYPLHTYWLCVKCHTRIHRRCA